MLDPRVQLQNRIIKTVISFDEAGIVKKTYESRGGRIQELILNSNGRIDQEVLGVYMRQDFSVTLFPNVAGGGLGIAEISLYNLNDDSSREIEAKGLYVSLEAGWEGKTGELFSGKISSITRTKRESGSTDVITTLYCKMGLDILQKGMFQGNFNQLTDILAVLAQIAESAGLSLQADSQIQGAVEGVTFDGDIVTILAKLSTQFNFNFYFTQKYLVLKAILPFSEVKVVQEYSPTNGLLDIPVVTEKGVDLRVFLNPQIRSGDGFRLTSKFANFNIGNLNYINRVRGQVLNTFSAQLNNNRYQGVYQAQSIYHDGSSHENTWETNISAMGAVQFQAINQTLRLDNL
jgi:hypothetical protein